MTAPVIVVVPPITTIRCGCSRVSSATTASGTLSGRTSSTGPWSRAATGATERASVYAKPEAMYAVVTPGRNAAFETFADAS